MVHGIGSGVFLPIKRIFEVTNLPCRTLDRDGYVPDRDYPK